METKVAALDVRVGNLEDRMDKHEADDDRFHRYNSHMLEDLLGKIVKIEIAAARFEADLVHRSVAENGTKESLDEIFKRLRMLERMAWIAVGSTTAFGSVVVYFGKTITNMLLK